MNRLRIILEMIKFEHTVFALPFAFLGAVLAARGFPGWETTLWIVLAMAGARSAAMAFNRFADRFYDALNSRTAGRALPRGLVSANFVLFFVVASAALFVLSSWMLNDLAFQLSPAALAIVLSYSYTKRFTSFSHLFLGLALAIAPVGGWIAVRGVLELPPFFLAAAVLFWVGGFDVIYACQDIDFDRRVGLHSLAVRLGVRNALRLSVFFHVLMMVFLASAFWQLRLSAFSWTGLILVASGLAYEHSLVSAEDLRRVNAAFFMVNGLISLVLFSFVSLDLWLLG